MKVAPANLQLRDGRSVTLRSPEATDAAATLTFLRQLARESFRNLNHPPSFWDATSVEAQAAFVAATLAHPRNFMIVACLGDLVVGSTSLAVASGVFSAHAAELGLGVLGACHGLGLGRGLTEALIFHAAAGGITNLTLRVRTFNHPAIRLYERLGFRRVGTLIDVARLPEPADEHVYQRLAAALV